jgi:hypothetical protein
MSLKVGTLVIIVNSKTPRLNGRVCEITGELAYRYFTFPCEERVLCYKTDLVVSGFIVCPEHYQVIPITPPNGEKDVHDYTPDVKTVKEKELV